jgi:hypothetical protein
MDGVEYRTSPLLRVTANLRHVVDICVRQRRQETEVWPDGGALIDQPERFLIARQIVWKYMDEFEGRANKDAKAEGQPTDARNP